ncbi:hypothetical protein MZO42_15235 [Sphingomonas psychrotolerans]|uniref:Uncharacterized protein n=1 Tax=Sphingomonas psychrotolerans TaxID=1327635 RepID=A0ABU3N9I8_9SPHN|nr:hypothetical protein [Sphingomonas psychrotolerans]MDT8760055.1 hypothetical protein [Sphingomonas psychrotolerans]
MILLALLLADALPQDRKIFPADGDDGTRTVTAEPRCERSSEEIVVCGDADSNRYRLKKIEPRYVEQPVRAARQVGPGELSLEAEQREFPGAVSQRAMVRLRIPLGRKKPK